jgi:hypothetical protein
MPKKQHELTLSECRNTGVIILPADACVLKFLRLCRYLVTLECFHFGVKYCIHVHSQVIVPSRNACPSNIS